MKVLFLLLMLTSSGFAQNTGNTPLTFYQAQFGGIDKYHDSAKIDNADFQEAQNVFTYRGYIEKRPGSVRISEGIKPGYPIVFQKEFTTSANASIFIVQAGSQVFASDFGTPFVQIATVNVNGILESVSAFGKHFFTNGYDTPWYTTGYDYTPVYEFPACTHLEFANERLWCTEGSTLRTSAYGDYTDWTIPIETPMPADVPNSWSFDAQDGKGISCLYASPYGLLAWKRNKMFVLKGFDNDDFYKFRLSDNIGCTDPRSIQVVEGRVTWLGVDGVYQWAGGNEAPELISRDIDPDMKQVRQNYAYLDQRVIDTLADFAAGTATFNGDTPTWSHTISPNSIVPSTTALLDNTSTTFGLGVNSIDVSTSLFMGTLTLATTTMFNFNFDGTTTTYLDDPILTSDASPLPQTLSTAAWTLNLADAPPDVVSQVASIGLERYLINSFFCLSGPSGYFGQLQNALIFQRCSWPPQSGYTVQVVESTTGYIAYQATYANNSDDAARTCTEYSVDMSTYTGTLYHIKVFDTYYPGINAVSDPFIRQAVPSTILYYRVGVGFELDNCATGGTNDFHIDFRVDSGANVYVSSGSFTSRVYDTGFTTPVSGTIDYTALPIGTTVAFDVRESTAAEGEWSTWTTGLSGSTGAIKLPLTKRFWQYKSVLGTQISSASPTLESISLNATTTGYWLSDVLFIGVAPTKWGQFLARTALTYAADVTYAVRAATYTFAQTDTTLAWTDQVNGLDVACATGTYVQVRVSATPVTSTDTIRIERISLSWSAGDVLQAASVYFDKNYYLGVTISTETSTNDTLLVYQRTGKWVMHKGLSYGTMGLYQLKPYVGSGFTDSKIWRIIEEGTYTDDTTLPIDAYVVTKDFQFDGQNNNKLLRQLYLESFPPLTSTLDLAYSVDKSTTYYTTAQPLQANVMFNDEIKKMFPGYAKGRYVKFKFSNTAINEAFKIDAYTVLGEYERLYRR